MKIERYISKKLKKTGILKTYSSFCTKFTHKFLLRGQTGSKGFWRPEGTIFIVIKLFVYILITTTSPLNVVFATSLWRVPLKSSEFNRISYRARFVPFIRYMTDMIFMMNILFTHNISELC